MLFALATPVAFLGLLVGFVLAVTVHGVVQAHVVAWLGDRTALAQRRGDLDPRHHLDPFGAVAAGIAGTGWARPIVPEPRRLVGTSRWVVVLLAGSVANLVLGLALVSLFLALDGSALLVQLLSPAAVLQGGDLPDTLSPGLTILLTVAIAQIGLGLLELVPLPPLDGGRLLFALAPHTSGWQRARYYLDDQNIGVAVLLALLLLPLVGNQPLLLVILDLVAAPLVHSLGKVAA